MSALVDQFGTRISGNTLYKTPSQRPLDFRPVPKPRAKTYEALSAWQRREQVDVSRVIAAGVPNIDTALTQAGEFSVGDSWHLKSKGAAAKSWRARRDEWFNETYARHGNRRGPQNDWRSTLRQLNWTRKVCGDYGIVFDAQTGQYHVITFDCINNGETIAGQPGAVSRGNGLERLRELPKTDAYYGRSFSRAGIYVIDDPASPFAGQRIIDGVILDAGAKVLGYRVTGFDDGGAPFYVDVPAAQMHLNFAARHHVDQVRGIPELAEAIMPIMGLDDIQYLVTMAMKLASALAVTRESADGNPRKANRVLVTEDRDDGAGNTVSVKTAVEEVFPGIIELSINKREALKVLEFDRPSMNEESFIARIETSVLHKLWPRALIYSENAGRAGMRAVAIQANTICTWDQCCLERSARWIADRATEWAMRTGQVPMNRNGFEPYDYGFTVPGKFTVDEGNDGKLRLAALSRCVISRGQICELEGYLAEEIEEQREEEIDRLILAAKRLNTKHPEFSVKELTLMFDKSETHVSVSEVAAKDEPQTGAEPDGNPPAANPAEDAE